MMAEREVVYHAVLMDRDYEMLGQLDSVGANPRYVVIVMTEDGPIVLGADDPPPEDGLPVGARTFHRIGGAVYTSALEASVLYEYLGEHV